MMKTSATQPVTIEELKKSLNEAILGNLCVQAVPSDYEILYLGFGNQIIEPPTIIGMPGEKAKYIRHGEPLYEIRTSYSHWWIEKEGKWLGGSEDQSKDETIAAHIVGLKALSWDFLAPNWGMKIDFEKNLVWQLKPFAHADGEEVWRLAFLEGVIWVLTNDGKAYMKREQA